MKAVATSIAAAALAAFLSAVQASAHSFYDPFCCNERDCTPIPSGSIIETDFGYSVDYVSPITGRHIKGMIVKGGLGHRWSKDGGEHACERHDIDAPRCIYVPIPSQ